MNAAFVTSGTGTRAYIQKKVRIDGKSTTHTIKRLGLLSDIQKEQGCPDPRQWVIDLAAKMTEEERLGKECVSIDFYPGRQISVGDRPLRHGGDMFLLPLYTGLGLKDICDEIQKHSRTKYDLWGILRTLVTGRILFPGSKSDTFEKAKSLVKAPKFTQADMFRAMSLLSGHIDDIQAAVYLNSKSVIERRERVIYYDCTNYYFEIEDNDKDVIDEETGEFIPGLRKRGKSKENRPNPIVQMGMFMDLDGIPLAFVIFPGNESEQQSLRPLEEKLNRKFGMTDYVVSTDSGLGSEENRRYNMAEGRDYICVQSLPKLKEDDRETALGEQGWRIAHTPSAEHASMLEKGYSDDGVFNLRTVLDAGLDEVEKETDPLLKQRKEAERQAAVASLLRDVTFYKEILATKDFSYEDEEWKRQKTADPGCTPVGKDGKPLPKEHKISRQERVIVTYSHDFALYLRHKRDQRRMVSEVIVKGKKKKEHQSQQSPYRYVRTVYVTKDGQKAEKVEMTIDEDLIRQEERLDGYYAYGTSLDDDGIDVLRIRSFHHEIEHLFRTTKSHLDARPVYLSRQDRIKTHFLTCFLAMLVIKMLQRQLTAANEECYREDPLTVDSLVETLRSFQFGLLPGNNYIPMFERTALTDQLQRLTGLDVNGQIIKSQKMNKIYKNVKID